MRQIYFLMLGILFAGGIAKAGADPGARARVELATFAGGCFWCMEPPFDKLDGVVATTAGFMGGHLVDPTYKQVSAGNSGHIEVVQVAYDPRVVTYETLLRVYWRNIDPTNPDGQFCDVGGQYRSAIFFHNEEQRSAAQKSIRALAEHRPFAEPIATELLDAAVFYPAEAYHQDYYQKNPLRYRFYRYRCGRDARLTEVWGEKSNPPL
ncbi:MAG: peptide-methionine (S)-S-oxide reductase MsrA [Pseudomonadota bacterium]